MNAQNSKLTKLKVSLLYRSLPIAVVAATLLMSASLTGAVTITSLTLNAEVDNTDTTANDITYRSKSRSIAGFTDSNNQQWALGSGSQPTVILRRSGVGTFANRQVVWARREGTGTPYVVLPSQPTTTQAILDQNNIYQGTDNLFTNTGNTPGNNSDVERLDVIFAQPVTVSANKAVAIFERGATNGHDGFKIAAITAVDPVDANLPLTYGNLLTTYQNTGSWGTTGLTGAQNYVVLNNTGTGGAFTNSATLSQEVGGEVIPLTSLANQGTTIRGYSLFGTDVTNEFLTAWNTFPTTTAEANGGLDLMAADLGVVQKAVPFGLSPSLGLLLLGAIWGFPSLWRHYRHKLAQS
jgi:hypothetical protein